MNYKSLLIGLVVCISFSSLHGGVFDDLKDELKDAAKETLEERKQELGLSDGNALPEPEDVSLVFTGSNNSSSETFRSLHTNAPVTFIPQFRPVILSPGVIAPLKEKECFSHVQGRIAWDNAGKAKKWASSNVKKLCKATTSKSAPGDCFKYVMRSGSSWGKKSTHKVNWQTAMDLCEGIVNYNKTTVCFKNAIKSGKNLNAAIKYCERK